MIIASFNVRGLGGRIKKSRVCDLIFKNHIDFLAVQETKMESVTDKLCHSIWGSEDCSWAVCPSVGNSGGMLSIWRKSSSTLIFSFVGEGYVGVCLEWGVERRRCFVVNVYSKCDLLVKRRLWETLTSVKMNLGGENWCFLGDFNSVISREERRGVSHVDSFSQEMREFADFVENLELVDIPIIGRRFTWFHPSGNAMSRIDRVLLSEEWIDVWGQNSLWVLPRDVLDHCPLLLKRNGFDWGPKPFRFNNAWLDHKDFAKLVEEFWRLQRVEGWMGFVLKEKLKRLKIHLKDWHKREFGGGDERIAVIVEEIKEIDTRGESGSIADHEIILRKTLFHELWRRLKSKDTAIYQSSRSKWLRQGDANSKFFHRCVAARKNINSLMALKVGDIWIESPHHIREVVALYFENHFSSPVLIRPKLEGVCFPSLSLEENSRLVDCFSEAEIVEVVRSSDGNKSPGPDGFNFAFLKKCWGTIKGEVRTEDIV
jgi:exonuclease III